MRNSPRNAAPLYHGQAPLVQGQETLRHTPPNVVKFPQISRRHDTSPGEVRMAEVPFSDGQGSKIRPVLVLKIQGKNIVVAPLTSHSARDHFDVELWNWEECGLPSPGTVRCSEIRSLSRNLVFRKVGEISEDDQARMSAATWRWFDSLLGDDPFR